MPKWLNRSLYGILGLLWLTGIVWLVLDHFFRAAGEFGSAPHPLEPRLLTLHGVLAVLAVFFAGWLAGTHVEKSWPRGFNRASGLLMIAALAVLALTGLGSYYLTGDALRSGTALVHELIGGLAILPALLHWLSKKPAT